MRTLNGFAPALALLLAVSLTSVLHAQSTFIFDGATTKTGVGSDANGTATWNLTSTNWSNGSSDVAWPNGADIARFGGSFSSTDTSFNTVVLSGTVNADGITFGNYSGVGSTAGKGYQVQNGTINDADGGTFTISVPGAFFNDDKFYGVTFTGASSYLFTGQTSASQGNGIQLANTTFDNNVAFGTGTDRGIVGVSNSTFASTHTLTVNKGWGLYFGANNVNFTQTMTVGGLGFNSAGQGGTFGLGGGNGNGVTGAVTLAGDISVLAAGNLSSGTAYSYVGGYKTAGTVAIPNGSGNSTTNITMGVGGIGGTGNVYYGFLGANKAAVEDLLVVTGDNNTYTGSSIIFNNAGLRTTTTGDNPAADGGVAAEAVQLNNSNALSTKGAIVLGLTANTALTLGDGTVINAANSASNSTTGTSVGWNGTQSNGALDLHGYNQTVTGLVNGTTTTPSGSLIFNDGSGATSTLTVNGTTSQSSGFAGTIEDQDATLVAAGLAQNTAGGKTALAVTGGALYLTGTANTYSGGTAVSGTGTLVVNNASGSATGVGPVTVSGASSSAYGVLAGGTPGSAKAKTGSATSFFYVSGGTTSNSGADSTGYIVGSGVNGVSINSGGHLAPGIAGIGTITVGDLTLNSGAVVDYEYDGSANDFTAVNGAFTLAGPTTFNLYQAGTTSAVTTTGVYDLFSYGSLGTPFLASNLTMGDPTAGLAYTFVNDTTDKLIQLDVTTAATPEPSTWAMLLGGVALLGFVIRRRSFNS